MRNDVCQPIVRTLLDHVDRKISWRTSPRRVPATAYCDPAHLAAERATLFSRWPQVVALSPDLPGPGSFVTRDRLGVPLVVTRGEDGRVRALANVCAHRGTQVVDDGRGCRHRLTCPYHAWTYDPAGTLVGLPDPKSFPDVTVPGPGLRPLPAVEEHGVIWVIPDLSGEGTPQPRLGAIGDDLDALDIGAYHYWRSHRFDLAMNWKLVIDSFLEPYHFASLHRTTVGPIFLNNLCHAERFGAHVREVLPRRTLTELADEPPGSWDLVAHSALVYVLFPNTVLVMQLDHIETWRISPDPVDPARSICDLDFFVPASSSTPSAERHWERNWELTIDTVIEEDFAAMAGVQRGLASGAIDAIRVGANEPALAMYHDALDDALGAPTHEASAQR